MSVQRCVWLPIMSIMTRGEIQTNPPRCGPTVCLPLSRCLTWSHLSRHVNHRPPPSRLLTAGGRRRSLSQLRLTLQIILSISRGGVMEQLSNHLCNYNRQPVTVVSSQHFIAMQKRQTQVKISLHYNTS